LTKNSKEKAISRCSVPSSQDLHFILQDLRSLWDVEQRRLVAIYQRFGTTYRPYLEETDRWFRNRYQDQCTLRPFSEERTPQLHRSARLQEINFI